MYNKCDKCNKQLSFHQERKLVLENDNLVTTRCMECYENYSKIKKSIA